MQPVRTIVWHLPCTGMAVFAAALAGGCASGTWLERSITAELPAEAPSRGYPTAITSPSTSAPAVARQTASYSLSDDDAPAEASEPSAAPAATVANATNHPPPATRERQTAHLPVLAVVPPQFANRAPAPAAPIAQPTPPAALAPSISPTFEPTLPTAFHPAALGEPALAGFPQPGFSPATQFVPLSPPASTAPPSIATTSVATAAGSEDRVAMATSVVATEAPATLDKAQSDWIAALEAEIRRRREASSTDEELPRLEQQLRLAYVAAGRLDEAASEIESLDAAQREAYKNLMFGLGIWLSPDEARRAPLRTAKVLHSLRDATTDLAASSKLEVRNLVFCERVDYFGWYTEFPRKEFQPKQQVLLYVEVQNFAAEHKGPGGYETELQGSYEILDGSGQIIASRQLPLDKEICRNYRRDYFLAYRIYMPDTIEPGHYRLELTVEDLKARGKYQGRKLGEGMIEFTVR